MKQKTHAGDRVAERHHLGVPAPVDPDVVKEVRQVPLEPPSAVLHEGGRRVPRPPGVLLGARGARRGRVGGGGGGAGGDGGARAPGRRKLRRRGRGRARRGQRRRRRRGQSSTNANRGAALLQHPSRLAKPRRSSESERRLDQGFRRKHSTPCRRRRWGSAEERRCGGHGDHRRWILSLSLSCFDAKEENKRRKKCSDLFNLSFFKNKKKAEED